MKRLLALVLIAGDPTPALAGSSCNGGGGSSGGSSSGGSSSGGGGGDSSYTSSDSASSASSACIDDTDVHGYRRCTKFGAWGATMRIPRLFVELGTTVRAFASGLASQQGSIAHGSESFAYRVVMPASDPRDLAVTSTLRLGFGVGSGFYSGIEGELGGLVSPASATTEMATSGTFGSPEVRQGRGLVLGLAAFAGFRATGRRAALAVEGAGGLRSVHYTFDSTYHHCVTETTIGVHRGIVEARARGEVWLSPWLTAGVALGTSLVDTSDWNAGLYLGVHSRAFAGGR